MLTGSSLDARWFYLDRRIRSKPFQEQRDILWEVLGLSDDMMCFGLNIDLFIGGYACLPVPSTNSAEPCLTTLNMCQLFDETFAARAAVSCFGSPML
jgi:hypothetical protein